MDSADPMNTTDDKEEEAESDNDNDLLAQARAALSLSRFAEAKSYATRALESSNLQQQQQQHVHLANQILAIANVHMAAESRLDGGCSIAHDWYAVLQLGSYTHNICTEDSLSFSYFNLANLLNPETNRFPNAAEALSLVKEAYNALSDHEKRSAYDALQGENIASKPKPAPGPTFWSVCRTCFHVHQYERVHEGKEMRCVVCKNGFVAAELPEVPSAVEGTDMYFCTWGFFPVGFPGGYSFSEEIWREKDKKVVAEEKEMVATPVPETVKRAKQTARKTVRPVRFDIRLRSCEREEEEEEEEGVGVDG